ncbi:cupredoxin domain-containing protein [Patescibacteria group bacterium]|nr:cupredoxin domain-containing protein [Patescibacteria group bacterium]
MKVLRTKILLSGIVLAAFLVSGCQAASNISLPEQIQNQLNSPAPTEASIVISNFTYEPGTIRVRRGATISVTNRDTVGHSVTSDDGASFDTGNIGENATVEFNAPLEPGTYNYHCTPHPNMTGTLIVE